jgi:hypothetical protein
MSFRLRKDARAWFKHLRPQLSIDFDTYYFCAIAGLAVGRKADVPTDDTAELVDYFPEVYRAKGRLLIALFLSRELRLLGINATERTALHSAIHSLVAPQSLSHLSDLGMREFNRYAWGGFEVLTEWFDDNPRTLATFLPLFKRRLDAALDAPAAT